MYKIMILEDEVTLRDELALLLQNAGYQPVPVTDFRNALEQMKNTPADLILLDINLPNANGEVLLQDREIKQGLHLQALSLRKVRLVEMRRIELLSETVSAGTISGCSQRLRYSPCA